MKKYAVSLIILLGLIGGTLFFYDDIVNNPYLRIQQVVIRGDHTHESEALLEETLLPVMTDKTFVSLRKSTVKIALFERFPWLDTITIRKIFPHKIVITLSEKVPFAIANQSLLITQDGVLFGPSPSTFPTGLPTLFFNEGEEKNTLALFKEFERHFEAQNLSLVSFSLHLSLIECTLNNGLIITLSDKRPLEHIEEFLAVYPKLLASNPKKKPLKVDLRYERGFSVVWG
jgi:cell division protein FtsQ